MNVTIFDITFIMETLTIEALTKIINNSAIKIVDVSDKFTEENIPKYITNIAWKDNVLLFVLRNEINGELLDRFDTENHVYLFYMEKCVCLPLEIDDDSIKMITDLIGEE